MISPRDAFADPAAFSRARAEPLPPDVRRAAIIDAVIPLLKERGRDVSTRQMAEAAGVAEGTLFRAFGDKESIIAAAIEHYFDPQPFRDRLRAIDPDDPTEAKVRQIISLLRERFEGVIGFVAALGHDPRAHRAAGEDEHAWLHVVERLFRPDELSVPLETAAFYFRLLAFGSVIPLFNEPRPFSDDELAGLVLRGVLPVERKD